MSAVFDYLFHFADFASRSPGTLVGAIMVSLQTPSGAEPRQNLPIAEFSRGALAADQTLGGYDGQSASMSGVLEGRFSDRHDVWGNPMTGSVDNIGLYVLTDNRTQSFSIVLNLMSWGHGRQTLTPVGMEDNILHLTGPSIGNVARSASYLISFSEGAPGLSWHAIEG